TTFGHGDGRVNTFTRPSSCAPWGEAPTHRVVSRPRCPGVTGDPVGAARRGAGRVATPRAVPSDHPEGDHRVGDLGEAGDVRAEHVVAGLAVLVGGLPAAVVHVGHDLGEARLGVLEVPGVPAGVLLHLERGGGDAPGVRGL